MIRTAALVALAALAAPLAGCADPYGYEYGGYSGYGGYGGYGYDWGPSYYSPPPAYYRDRPHAGPAWRPPPERGGGAARFWGLDRANRGFGGNTSRDPGFHAPAPRAAPAPAPLAPRGGPPIFGGPQSGPRQEQGAD